MVTLSALLGLIGVVIPSTIAYFTYKHQSLRSNGDIQEEIEKRLRPKYSIDSPNVIDIISHLEWPSDKLYYTVWHVEVYEQRWGSWKKWLPRGSFKGRTEVVYEISDIDPPPVEQLRQHHLFRQPYVQGLELESENPVRIKVIYDSNDPNNISLYVKQFRHLVRDTLFYALNPEVEIQYEVFTLKDGQEERPFARLYDANKSESFTQNRDY
jgi:hypothetical protein